MKRFFALGLVLFIAAGSYSIVHSQRVIGSSEAFWLDMVYPSDWTDSRRAPHTSAAQYGFIDNSGRFVIAPAFDDCLEFKEGLAAFRKGSFWGYMNKRGEKIIPAQFRRAYDFSHGLARVRRGIYTGYIDRRGKFVIPATYSRGYDFDEHGLAAVCVPGRRFNLLDTKGRKVLSRDFDECGALSEGLISVRFGDQWGVFDLHGKVVVPPRYDGISECREGLMVFRKGQNCGYIDRRGGIVIEPKYAQAGLFSGGVAAVKRADGSACLITKDEQITFRFPNNYSQITSIASFDASDRIRYEGSLVPVLEKNLWGYMSASTGKFVIKPQFSEAGVFHDGIARVAVPASSGREE